MRTFSRHITASILRNDYNVIKRNVDLT